MKASDIFFTDPAKDKVEFSNILILYNLTPDTVCNIKDVKVCPERCLDQTYLYEAFAQMGSQVFVSLFLGLYMLLV